MEDKMMAWASIPLLIRMGLVHVVLLFGTNNTTTDGLTQEQIGHRVIGAKLVLAARIFYAMFIWLSKLTVSEFLKRLTVASWNRKYEVVLQGIRIFLLITFIGVVIGTLAECQPFDHYWQVVPDPGPSCRNGYAQLFVMGICDIITDVVLIIFPLPVLLRSSMPLKRRLMLCLLYSLSIFLIAIAAYRIPAIVNVHGRQQRRSLWASLEILASAACSNAVIIGSFVRDRGVKKRRYRRDETRRLESADAPSINRTFTQQHWGNDSDEDLFRSVRGRMNSLASQGTERPARLDVVEPMPTIHSPLHLPLDKRDSDSQFKEIALHNWSEKKMRASDDLSIQDPGGLLKEGSSSSASASHQSPRGSTTNDFATVTRGRLSSFAGASRENQAVAGASDARRGSAATQNGLPPRHRSTLPPNGRPIGPGDDIELQDAGGLLS